MLLVLILIFLENALRLMQLMIFKKRKIRLNPYFFGKCSTASCNFKNAILLLLCLNPYFFGKCSTALKFV